MLELKALLEGKILMISEEPNTGDRWDYPNVIDEETGDIVVDKKTNRPMKIVDPFCNIQGQKTILSFASMRLRAGTVLSNYSIETVLDRTFDDANKLALELKLNLRKWNIDPTRWEELHFTIMDRIEAARRRAVNNEERKGTGASMTHTTIHQDNPSGRNVGFLSGMMGRPKSRM